MTSTISYSFLFIIINVIVIILYFNFGSLQKTFFNVKKANILYSYFRLGSSQVTIVSVENATTRYSNFQFGSSQPTPINVENTTTGYSNFQFGSSQATSINVENTTTGYPYSSFRSSQVTSINVKKVNTRYSYYVCTQIYNEPELYLFDWLDHQFNVIGFKNVCLINVGKPLSASLRKQFPFAYIERKIRIQQFHFCLSSCFVDKPMRPEDMLMIQDIDEYLNVKQSDEIFKNYDKYTQFHFYEVRYGYVKNTDREMFNQSLRAVNVWRKPHQYLGEYVGENLKKLHNCTVAGGWPSCEEGAGKEMIRVGTIKSLSVHYHNSNIQPVKRFRVQMNKIRLNHYIMRTRDDAVESGKKWSKLASRLGQIDSNSWFRIVLDDSVRKSKRLF